MESFGPGGQVSWLADPRTVPAFPFAFRPVSGVGVTVAVFVERYSPLTVAAPRGLRTHFA